MGGDHCGMPLRLRPVTLVVERGEDEPLEELSSMSPRAVRKDDMFMAVGAVGGPDERDTSAFRMVCAGMLGTSVERAFFLCPWKLLGIRKDREEDL